MKINLIKNYSGVLIFILSYCSLLFSFSLNEDGTGFGASGDFKATYGFIFALRDNFLANPTEWTLVHTPLHFIILSFVSRIVDEPNILRLLFCFFSIILPFIFLRILEVNFNEKINNNLLILSSCIFFIPSFRYTSIWANDLITSLIFFSFSIFFFKKWENAKGVNLDRNILFQTLFLVLATYTRQYFAIFFIYFLYQYIITINLKEFFKLFGLCVLSSIPVLLYVYKFPELLTGQLISYKALSYFLLGNSSIISITLYPIVFINFLYKKIIFDKNLLLYFLTSIFLVIIMQFNFNPENWQGGGINHLISSKIFNNNLYFYFTSVFTFTFFIYLFFENKQNLILILILLFMFFSYQVYQRYYDPMFFIIFFTLIKTDLIKIFSEKIISNIILLLYFITYYIFAVSDFIYKFY